MTAVRLRNNTKIDLPLPNGLTVKAGRSALVPNYQHLESSDLVRGWIAAKALEVVTDKATRRADRDARRAEREQNPATMTGPADTFERDPDDEQSEEDKRATRQRVKR